jgi:hypothetical protein
VEDSESFTGHTAVVDRSGVEIPDLGFGNRSRRMDLTNSQAEERLATTESLQVISADLGTRSDKRLNRPPACIRSSDKLNLR